MSNYFDDPSNMGSDELTDEEKELLARSANSGLYQNVGKGADAALGLIPIFGPAVQSLGISEKLGKMIGDSEKVVSERELALINKQQGQKNQQKADQLQAIQGLLGRWTPYQ